MSGPDMGRCFTFNLRSGMYMCFILQVAIVCLFSYMSLSFFYDKNMETFFFFRGVVMNTGVVLFIATGVATVVTGAFVVLVPPEGSPKRRRVAHQSARLWMWLSMAMVPLQFYYGGYLAVKCSWLMRKLTPSILISDVAFQRAMGGKKGGMQVFNTMMNLGGDGDKDDKSGKKKKASELPASVQQLDDPVANAKKVEAETEAKMPSWRKSIVSFVKRHESKFMLGIAFGAMVLSVILNETERIRSMLPPPLNTLYGMGLNFLITFLLYGWVPGLVHGAVALHVAAYQAVLGKGGVGDEFVGWKRLPWFYSLSAEKRREVRAGARPEDLRKRLTADIAYDEDSDSGEEYLETIEEDKAGKAVVVAELQRARGPGKSRRISKSPRSKSSHEHDNV